MMNIKSTQLFGVTGDWSKQATSLKEKYTYLTDVDLKFEAGKEEQLLTRLQQRLKKNRDEVIAIIRSVEAPKAETPKVEALKTEGPKVEAQVEAQAEAAKTTNP